MGAMNRKHYARSGSDRQSGNARIQSGRLSSSISAWLSLCTRLRHKGGFKTALDGKSFRCRIKEEYFNLIQPFCRSHWLGWPIGSDSFRVAPPCAAKKLFLNDQRLIRKTRSSASVATTIGTTPVDIEFRSKGRICLPEQLTRPCKINTGTDLFVLIGNGFFEIWPLERWIAHCELNGTIIHGEQITRGLSKPSSPINNQLIPSTASSRSSGDLVKCVSRKDGMVQ
jgi:hypothetical protein